jgi:uncharacterized protein YlzI (FlbEa/FlbD family)
MTSSSEQPPKEPTCTTKCPAIRDDKGSWYCRIMRACVAPSEHHFDYGFDIIKGGKITHSGYSTPCNAMALFGPRPSPAQQPNEYHIDYLECARMDIRGNAYLANGSMVVDMEEVDAVINKLKEERIRSRHSPAPTPCPQHQIWQHCPVAGEIARKAREDVLDKVIAWKRKHGYWFTANRISGEKRYHFEPDRFEEFIKEIRHNAQQSEQEQPR